MATTLDFDANIEMIATDKGHMYWTQKRNWENGPISYSILFLESYFSVIFLNPRMVALRMPSIRELHCNCITTTNDR